jgi:hypothetical protein
MTIKLELTPETEARLTAQAKAQGLPPEKVAERILEDALEERSPGRGSISVEEFHQMLAALAQGCETLPNLSTSSFSRESFYEDRLDGRGAVPPR